MTGARRALAVSATVAIAFAASVAFASPASADTSSDPILLSSDGTVFVTSLPGGLFDSFQGAVPGDSTTKSFYVRNPEAFEVTMKTLALDVTSTSSELESSITVDGETGGRSLPAPVSLSALSDCSTLAPDVVIAAHAVAKVSLTLAFSDVSGKVAQASRGGFNVFLTMVDNAAGTPTASCGGSIPSGGGGSHHHHHPPKGGGSGTASPTIFGHPLAFTGLEIGGELFVGVVLLGLGLLFLATRRRRREREKS